MGQLSASDIDALLGGINASALNRYLKGFIDLIFEWQGRYYVVDHKSNHLKTIGVIMPCIALFDARPQIRSQSDLYTALDQLLSRRLPDYQPQKHQGQVFHLRGMKSFL